VFTRYDSRTKSNTVDSSDCRSDRTDEAFTRCDRVNAHLPSWRCTVQVYRLTCPMDTLQSALLRVTAKQSSESVLHSSWIPHPRRRPINCRARRAPQSTGNRRL